jgi:flagellar assembly protein FliH
LFKNFAPQSLTTLEADPNPETQSANGVSTFAGEDFTPPKAATNHFADFQENKAPRSGAPKAQPKGAFQEEMVKTTPSLGYLFAPFEPGEPAYKGFDAYTPPAATSFDFKELEAKDERIINTLDKAEKKAQETLDLAQKKAKELEEEARERLAQMSAEVKAQAESAAEEVKKSAELEAQEYLAASAASVGDLEKLRLENQNLTEDITQLKASLKDAEDKFVLQSAELKASFEDLENQKKALADLGLKQAQEAEEAKAEALKAGQKEGFALGQELGLKDGLAQGEEKAHKEFMAKVQGLMDALGKVNDLWPGLWEANGAFMVRLAVDAAEAMVNKEIENGRGLAAGAFKACVTHLSHSHEAIFRICPGDMAELEVARADPHIGLDSLVNIKFIPDPALGPGDLIMESDVGRLDATMKTRREKVLSVLKEALNQGVIGAVPEAPKEGGLDPVPAGQVPSAPAAASPNPTA